MQNKIKVQVIIGSTRQGRYSDKPAYWIMQELKQWPELEAELVDLRDYPLPFYDEPTSPMMLQGNYSNPAIAKWAGKIKEADAYIMIAPEYNHGYTAVLKNAIDHLYPEWNNKPVAFLSFGNVGGARVVEQLRLVAIELQMLPIKSAIHIPAEAYLATMALPAEQTVDIYNKAVRQGYRDHVSLVATELLTLAQKLKPQPATV